MRAQPYLPRTRRSQAGTRPRCAAAWLSLAHLLLSGGCQVAVVRNDEVSAQDIAAAGPFGIVISPGPCAPADARISIATVRACGAATPLLGVCLGYQVIAAAYGARITMAPRPVHGRASLITHDGRGLLADLPRRTAASCWST